MKYSFKDVEKKWQKYWDDQKTYKTPESLQGPKYYVLDMFPYPSGAGLHVGHPEGYTATDIMARFKRMRGFHVLHPMGWDAFGLPAERYAMTTGIHPAVTTASNIENFKRQMKSIGFSYDWDREINTTDKNYYKWTQWIFLKIFNSWYDEEGGKARPISELRIPAEMQGDNKKKERRNYINSKRLAYIDEIPVNWCEALGTVLANEEVEEWTQKGYTVERRPMRQWMLRITAYAERLLNDLELVDWPSGTLELQKSWIGKSYGAEIDFKLQGYEGHLRVYTTRPDTVFGVTYMVVAPEHPVAEILTTSEKKTEVEEYRKNATLKSELDRQLEAERGQKTGVFTGGYVIHPFTGKKIPVWVADYVLMSYGHGAIMAVPGHDERDFAFAKTFDLPVTYVISEDGKMNPDESKPFTGNGISMNSPGISGLQTDDAREKMISILEERKIGKSKVNYRLRDWLFSRQRYWGEPVPVGIDADGEFVVDENLPLELPHAENFQPAGTGESPLANIDEWVNTVTKDGRKVRRETNTMPQWAGSSWYYLRYLDPKNDGEIADPAKEKYWLENGVDLYVGGAEHAVLHLLYSRFWHKVLFDYGVVSFPEPFRKLVHQGLILGEDGSKMSKSRGNVVNPDDVIESYGADAFRLFEMFMGPLEQMKPWSSRGIEGVNRFLLRVWRFFIEDEGGMKAEIRNEKGIDPALNKALHQTIKKVTLDIENLSFNTAISQMMVFMNQAYQTPKINLVSAESFFKLLYPFAPHMAEELWNLAGNKNTISYEPWPHHDESLIREDEFELVIQINGKIRSKQNAPVGSSDEAIREIAFSDEKIKKSLEGQTIKKMIVVKNKLVNFII